MLRAQADAGHPHSVLYDFSPEVLHAVSTRHGGVSPEPYQSLNMGISTGDDPENVRVNRSSFAAEHDVCMDDVLVGRLSHGVDVSVFGRDRRADWPVHRVHRPESPGRSEGVFRSDAVISNAPGQYFLLTFADCVPLLFYDPVNRAMGAAHAGWRGTSLGMARVVIRAMQAEFGTRPGDLRAAVGPSIGPCCYSVRPDVLETFDRNRVPATYDKRDGTFFLDLWRTNECQITGAGVCPDRVQNKRLCTSCQVRTFYSHRAEVGQTGRFALLSGIRQTST